jgi:hypothetical protein
MGSVAQFDFVGKIQESGIKNSMTYRLPNSRKSNFATEPTKKRARRHRVVKHTVQRRLTTLRRKSRRQPMLDDALPANAANAVLDHTPSSLQAVEGYLVSPSHRALSLAILDDIVSPKPSREGARWQPVRKPLLPGVLGDILRLTSKDSPRARVVKSRSRWSLTTVRRHVHHRMILDDHRLHFHVKGRCLMTGSRRVPLSTVLDVTGS